MLSYSFTLEYCLFFVQQIAIQIKLVHTSMHGKTTEPSVNAMRQ